MGKSERVRSGASRRRVASVCAIVALLTLWAGTSVAAPATKARVKKMVFNPALLKPVWVSNPTARTGSEPILTDVFMLGLNAAGGSGGVSAVTVSARPAPRSPYVPPTVLSPLPPWLANGQ
jgi:hypothetical protein